MRECRTCRLQQALLPTAVDVPDVQGLPADAHHAVVGLEALVTGAAVVLVVDAVQPGDVVLLALIEQIKIATEFVRSSLAKF